MADARPTRPPGDRRPDRPRRGSPPPRRGGRRLLTRPVVIAAALLLLVVAGLVAAVALSGDDAGKAPAAVRIAGVDVSHKTSAEILAVTRRRARELLGKRLIITRADKPSFRIATTRRELGASPRIRVAVNAALEARSLAGRAIASIGLASTREVPITFTVVPAKVNALVNRVTDEINRDPRPAAVEVSATAMTVTPGVGGYGVDPIALRKTISTLPERIVLRPGPLSPPVSEQAADRARLIATRIVSHPVSVTLDGRGVPIEPEVLRSALRFVPEPPKLKVTLDPDTLYARIKSAYATREQPARDATFRIVGSSARVVPSRVGRSLNMPAIAAAIVSSPDATSVRARFKVSRPSRTTAQLKALKITSLVSEFTTPYNCCEPRVTNIQRAAELINGTILPPGRTFSLNDALGQRTTARGFVEAPQIAGGRLEDAVGGGVSQVSTTLYNAAFFAGLALVAHTPHEFWISRYPKGREATLSFGGPELIFTNDWDAGLLMEANAGSNGITIAFYSSPLGRRVETETGEPHDVVEPTTKETLDPSLAPGERVVEQSSGGAGFTVSYTRKVYEGDTLRNDETYTWTYRPVNAFVKVGPPKPKGSTTAPKGRTTAPGTTTSTPSTPSAPSRGATPTPAPAGSTTSSAGQAAPPP